VPRRALVALLLASLAIASTSCGGGGQRVDATDTSRYPPEIREAYDVFAVHCSKCHALARPLTARITDPRHWDLYVARMRRMPASGISPNDARVILRFLHYYVRLRRAELEGATEQPEYVPEAESPPADEAPAPAHPSPTTAPESAPPPEHAADAGVAGESAPPKPTDGRTR